MKYKFDFKQSDWDFVNVEFEVKPKEARRVHDLNLTYAEIFKMYMIPQINRFARQGHVMYPNEWMKSRLNEYSIGKCLIGNIDDSEVSKSIIVNILQRGFNDLLNNHKCDKPIRDLYATYGEVRSDDCVKLLHDMKLFGKYNLTVPHIPIQATFNIGDQIMIDRVVKIPKYSKKLYVAKETVDQLPTSIIPKSARIYTRSYQDGRYRVYATMSCMKGETDNEGFTKLLRKYMRG
jgi:hypothetical protein